MAMIMAIMLSLVMVLIPMAMMTANLGQLPLSRYDQDRATALAAAEAGVQDYINRLNHNPNYWEYNATNPPPDGNQALSSPVVWVPVSSQSTSSYHYTVNTSAVGSQGIVYLTSYGKSRNAQRIIKVGLRQVGFLDDLSLSNYNLVDPELYPAVNNSVSQTTTDCVYDYWQQNASEPAGNYGPNMSACSGLINYWITGNVIDGPIRSNDDYYLNGTPTFLDSVVTGDPNSTNLPYWHDPAGGGADHPVFDQPYSGSQAIQGAGTITFPPSDASIQNYTTIGQAGAGCLYTGPTAIQLNGTTMTVVSPDTKSTNQIWSAAQNKYVSCVGTGIPLPSNGVIFVQGIPSSTSDPNYGSCQVNPSSWDGAAAYGDTCSQGDVFVQGTLNGQLTIAAQNDVFITGDITYNNFTGDSVLGLIANNFVLVNHPVNGSSTVVGTEPFVTGSAIPTFKVPADYGTSSCTVSTNCTVTVDAAILTVQHSLGTANFLTGGVLGTLAINGAISGEFMDIEGVFNSSGSQLVDGYNEDYTYDNRLQHLTPPYFLDPSQTTWHEISYEECPLTGCLS